ncbi:MAG: glycosyltransferase family 9 protein, partial [Candidatus Omnitrophica bacterium]|nr:glycosyltransferase family 9 protein [Candidatus Omnitrophota bacterium]
SFFAWLKNIIAFLERIKKEHFDVALDFSLNTQYGFFAWYAGIRQRAGFDFKKRGGFLTRKIKLSGYSDKHIVEYYAELLKFLGVDLKYRKLELYPKEDMRRAEEILTKAGVGRADLVGIIPGAGRSWGKDAYLKHWLPENFAQLADKIIENHQAEIIIMGDFSEKKIAQKIIKNMKQKAVDLSGMTTIGELSALLSKMKLAITNDGGPLHIAVALGKKTVSFFGPVDPKVYGPYPADENRHIVLRKNLECSPCYRNFRLRACYRNGECLKTIDVKEACEAVERLLN